MLDAAALPDFPWDSLAPHRRTAERHPDGIVDLSIGTPVDPTPDVVAGALAGGAQWPGYPPTIGTPRLREAMVAWWDRRRGVPGLHPDQVLPTIGSKEAVALLPAFLGLGRGDAVLHPATAYPTYDVGARLTGALAVPVDIADPGSWAAQVARRTREAGRAAQTHVGRDGDVPRVALVWVNSPSNPDGSVLDVARLRAVVEAARGLGALVVSDECYAELGFAGPWADPDVRIPSLLDPRVAGDARSLSGVLALYSLSKQSNLAGYRAAMLAGDPQLVARVREVRKHAGMMMPGPVQDAMAVALDDDAHVDAQRERYRSRRSILVNALPAAGLTASPDGVAGLYLWVTLEEQAAARLARADPHWDCLRLVEALAERGILAAPGAFYGVSGRRHVRIALTASDERIAAAAGRLAAAPLF